MKVNITIQEIYDLMCKECREKTSKLVTQKLLETSVKKSLEKKQQGK